VFTFLFVKEVKKFDQVGFYLLIAERGGGGEGDIVSEDVVE
jgi:hypothetical protein